MKTLNRPSFEEIDYTVRPAKCVERKMIGEVIGLLQIFQHVHNYSYIGLGSTFFTDFVLYHRSFDFCNMFSIEKEQTKRNRIEFNIPFKCIKVHYGETTDVLPRLDWRKPSIVWLDYDGPINSRNQADITFLSQNLVSSSLLMITLRVDPRDFDNGTAPPDLDIRLSRLREALGGKIPDLKKQDVGDLGKAIQMITNAAIFDALAEANAAKSPFTKIEAHQLMFFKYADGAKMLTIGWLYLNKSDFQKFKDSKIHQLPFFKPGIDPYLIVPPKLTFRERKHLDRQLPGTNISCPDVPAEDIQEYSKLYRYYPSFVEAEI